MKNQNNVIEQFNWKKAIEKAQKTKNDLKLIKSEMSNIDCKKICLNDQINYKSDCEKVCKSGLKSIHSVLEDKLKA